MNSKDTPVQDAVEDEAFKKEMAEQYILFAKAHFGEPVCEECLKNIPE